MIKKFYSILDLTAKTFLNPLEAKNHSDAIRMFTTFVNGDKEQSNVASYPNQFILYHLFDMDDLLGTTGTYNPQTQKLEPQAPPTELITGTACVEEQNKTYTIDDLMYKLTEKLIENNVVDLTTAKPPKFGE